MYYVKLEFKLCAKGGESISLSLKDSIEFNKFINDNIPDNMLFLFDFNNPKELTASIAIDPITTDIELNKNISNIINTPKEKDKNQLETDVKLRGNTVPLLLVEEELNSCTKDINIINELFYYKNNSVNVFKKYEKYNKEFSIKADMISYTIISQINLSEYSKMVNLNKITQEYSSGFINELYYISDELSESTSCSELQRGVSNFKSNIYNLINYNTEKEIIANKLIKMWIFYKPYTSLFDLESSNFIIDNSYRNGKDINHYVFKEDIKKVNTVILNSKSLITLPIIKLYANNLDQLKEMIYKVGKNSNIIQNRKSDINSYQSINVISIEEIMYCCVNLVAGKENKKSYEYIIEKISTDFISYLKGSSVVFRIPIINFEYNNNCDVSFIKNNNSMYVSANKTENKYRSNGINSINPHLMSETSIEYSNLMVNRMTVNTKLNNTETVFNNSSIGRNIFGNYYLKTDTNKSYGFDKNPFLNYLTEKYLETILNINSEVYKEVKELFELLFENIILALKRYCPIFIWYEDTEPYNDSFIIPEICKKYVVGICKPYPFKTKYGLKEEIKNMINKLNINNPDIAEEDINNFVTSDTLDFIYNNIKNSDSVKSIFNIKSSLYDIYSLFKYTKNKDIWKIFINENILDLNNTNDDNNKDSSKIYEAELIELNSLYHTTNKENFSDSNESDTKENDNTIQSIDDLIGLKDVKRILKEYTSFVALEDYKFKKDMYTDNTFSKHMCFLGNPGTCKTTVANLLAKELYKIGILSSDYVKVVSRADLVEKYVGWTAKNVENILSEILKKDGGILFIDEAYSLVDGGDNSYGKEAIDALVNCMDQKIVRDKVIIIFAGYPKEMKEFLNTNSGLPSRISTIVKFPNYNEEELIEIATYMAKDKSLILVDGFITKLKESIRKYIKRSDFGNGRFIRSIIEKSIIKQSYRLFKESNELKTEISEEELKTLKEEDFSDDNIFNNENIKSKIGFNI